MTDDEYMEEAEVEVEVRKYQESKIPFRFPLISDEEKLNALNGNRLEVKKEKQIIERDPFYDRETVFPAPPKKKEYPLPTQQKFSSKPKIEEVTTQRAAVKKRPFTPSQVPSPVHGYTRPTNNKVEQKTVAKQHVSSKPIEQHTFENSILSSIVEDSKKVRMIEEKNKPNALVESVSTKLSKEELIIENNTSHFSEETSFPSQVEITPPISGSFTESEKVSAAAEVAVSKLEKEPEKEPFQPTESKKKENIRPFNVLMLKSDKEKMNKLENTKQIMDFTPKKVSAPVYQEAPLEQEEFEQPVSNYTRPSFSFLLPPEMKDEDKEWMEEQASTLIEALSYFQVSGEILQVVQGPAVTQFELTVGHGTKVSKIRNLADDLKLALAAKDIRIQAPIPGKSSIGIEIPNRNSRAVRISEVLNTEVFKESESPLEAALGLDLTGKPVTLDLRKMPHGLIAGATGSGKSVFINSLLVSLLYKATPEEVKLLLIDPKMVELAPFNHIPHLVSPVITDVKAATAALKWAVEEMERRYQLFAHIGVRDIGRYNLLATEKRQFAQKLPYIVIVIDELADLMMMAPTEVEDAICRIAQKARACGIHLVLATQRPSVDVITGLIKANVPTRIAFSVSSQIDSRTILDQQGAERLLGKGDMLYQGNGMSSPVRVQGTYVSDDEIESIIEHARAQGSPDYLFEQEELLQRAEVADQDDLFEEACRFVVEQGTASTSLLQRKFHLGYNRAARLIDSMQEHGYISEQRGSKAREVLLTNEMIDEIFS